MASSYITYHISYAAVDGGIAIVAAVIVIDVAAVVAAAIFVFAAIAVAAVVVAGFKPLTAVAFTINSYCWQW